MMTIYCDKIIGTIKTEYTSLSYDCDELGSIFFGVTKQKVKFRVMFKNKLLRMIYIINNDLMMGFESIPLSQMPVDNCKYCIKSMTTSDI